MPPKNNITFGPGTLYFNTPEGPHPLGEVQEVTITEEEPELDILGNKPRVICQKANELTAELTLSPETSEYIKTIIATAQLAARVIKLFQSYPNGRVKHLALHHKKVRVRKKNMRRICRDLKRRSRKNDRT